MFRVRVRLIFPLQLSYKLGAGCIAFYLTISFASIHACFPMLLNSTVGKALRAPKGSEKQSTQRLFYPFSSSCIVILMLRVLRVCSINFFNSVVGPSEWSIQAEWSEKAIHLACQLENEKKNPDEFKPLASAYRLISSCCFSYILTAKVFKQAQNNFCCQIYYWVRFELVSNLGLL